MRSLIEPIENRLDKMVGFKEIKDYLILIVNY